MGEPIRSRDRKQSPDVLAELLGPEPLISQSSGPQLLPVPVLPSTAAPRPARTQPPAEARSKRPPQSVVEVALPVWETQVVTFQDHRGWRPRYVDGIELNNWLTGPFVHEYLRGRSAEGWELAAATSVGHFYGVADSLQFFFKRRK